MAGDTSTSSLIRNLGNSGNNIKKIFDKLSSGKRINSASDDAAGLAIVSALDASVVQLSQGSRNAQDSQSALSIAEGALGEIGNIASRLSELATQSANGTLSDTQRTALQTEYGQLTQEIQRIAATTEFNGQNLLDGTSFTSQVGTTAGQNSQITVQEANVSTLVSGIASSNISSQASAQSALSSISSFIQSASSARGDIGATSSRLDVAVSNNNTRKVNETAAASRIRDVDIAEETAKLTAEKIKQEAGAAQLAQVGKLNADRVRRLLG